VKVMTLLRMCSTSDVPEGESRQFTLPNGTLIAIANLGPDEGWRAIDDVCSHEEYYLHEGEVDADFETIECPKHGSVFDLNTGKPRSLPATIPLPVYPVKVEGDDVLIEVEE
jgi:3-phenylpropionate/trans-cinnamate dioxygenase ferredoxin component